MEQQQYRSARVKSLHWLNHFRWLLVELERQQVLPQRLYQIRTIHQLDILIYQQEQQPNGPEVQLLE
jgi:hypothetical protein